jgi:hypothetical protein
MDDIHAAAERLQTLDRRFPTCQEVPAIDTGANARVRPSIALTTLSSLS